METGLVIGLNGIVICGNVDDVHLQKRKKNKNEPETLMTCFHGEKSDLFMNRMLRIMLSWNRQSLPMI